MRISDWSSDVCSSDLSRCHCRRSFRRSAPRSAVSPLAVRLRLRLTLSCPALRKLAVDVLSRCDRSVVSASPPPRAARGQRSPVRSEERRGGKECVRQGRSRGWPYHLKKKKKTT